MTTGHIVRFSNGTPLAPYVLRSIVTFRNYRHDNHRYRPRRLGRNDRIFRGSDNRYYCRRDDGTTGLIVGGIGGGVLGHIIAPGGSKTLGTIIGAGAGALLGKAVDRGGIVCRWSIAPVG